MANSSEWDSFCERAAAILRDALANRITLEAASRFFENESPIGDRDTRAYIESMIWEIDGSPSYYLQILE